MSVGDFLSTVALPAFVGGGSAWLLLQYLGDKILTHRLSKDVERYKVELAAKTDVLKTQLSIFAHEQTVAISRVDSQRADAIHKVYAALREIINPISLIVSGSPYVNAMTETSASFYVQNAESAHAACGKLVNTLADLAIYFDNETYKETMLFAEAAMNGAGAYLQDLRKADGEGESLEEILRIAETNRAQLKVANTSTITPRAKNLTSLFRQQLGVEQIKPDLPK